MHPTGMPSCVKLHWPFICFLDSFVDLFSK